MIKVKKYKHTFYVCAYIIFSIFNTSSIAAKTSEKEPSYQSPQTTLDETDKLALQTYCNTVANMFTIVQDPDNKQNVTTCIGNIATGIINFVVHVIAHNKSNSCYYQDLNHQLQALLDNDICNKNNPISFGIADATQEIEAMGMSEQTAPISHLTENIHELFATINSIVNNLYSLAQNQKNAQKISAQINNLLEKTICIAVETMKNQYLQGHATEEDFANYLESLEDLQEKIKHAIVTNALHLKKE